MDITSHRSTPNLVTDLSPRNPRVHRQTGIPSIFRPSGSSNDIGDGTGKNSTKKKRSYHLLSISNLTSRVKDKHKDRDSGNDDEDDFVPPTSPRRRFVSMPQLLPSNFQQIAIENSRIAGGRGSPPIVDFTRFEDTYRGPRNGAFEGLVARQSTPKSRSSSSRMRSSSSGVKPLLKTNSASPINGLLSTDFEASTYPASERKPDPRLLLSTLQDILGFSQRIENYFNTHELLGAHQVDQLEFEEREAVKAGAAKKRKLEVPGQRGPLVVLGESLRKASIYSTTPMVLGGREHELPIVVVNCVEELYRTGIYQPNLFRTLPNRSRLLELIKIFDSEEQPPGSIIRSRSRQQSSEDNLKSQFTTIAGFGAQTSLHLESTPDICALLTTYLSALPEPILTPLVFRAIWDWCGLDQEEGAAGHGDDDHDNGITHELRRRRLSSVPLTRTYTSPTESTHILIAQLLLHLLPSAHFSLFVYLLAFFSQVVLVREENGVGVEDLGKMFGSKIFGDSLPISKDKGKAKAPSNSTLTGDDPTSDTLPVQTSDHQTSGQRWDGDSMMRWFLRRWGPISEGLFDVVDDARMGLFKRTLARRDSLGKDILSSWLSEPMRPLPVDVSPEGMDNCRPEERPVTPAKTSDPPLTHPGSPGRSKWLQRVPIPRINIVEGSPQSHSTPKSSGLMKEYCTPESPVQEADIVDQSEDDFVVLTPTPVSTVRFPLPQDNNNEENETLDITHRPGTARVVSNVDTDSTYSSLSTSSSLDERLMDVSMPTSLLDQTLPTTTTALPETSKTRTRTSHGMQTDPQAVDAFDGNPSRVTQLQPDSQQPKLVKALELITDLEKQLKDRTECLTDALRDLGRCKLDLESCQRRHHVRELEKAVAIGDVGAQYRGPQTSNAKGEDVGEVDRR
ncbi:hypothetical protein GALMADRAFT_240517 [Galerina marginata CBS 339.88]|uniref:Rho-GAP domain-containing protein n=1 Tax=Galerina marginata (strain CBS 339.88) TaxID=685588 RepID=A0A067TFZ1_GALM3|nr:hypothetical protein GALMADRAFT_240517 [Galerina marginata CBS 339.88]